MDGLLNIDWSQLFALTMSPLELMLRGTVTYLGIFALLRLVVRRDAATISISDLLVVVLIADAGQNAMAGEYRSLSDGAILVGTIVGWSYLLDRLAYHYPGFGRFVHPPPLPLVRNGRMQRANMRREFISEEELMTQLRERGIEDIDEVKVAYLEGDGRVSVIKRRGSARR